MKRFDDLGLLAAGAALAGAVLLFGALLVQATITTPITVSEAAEWTPLPETASEPAADDEVLAMAARQAPFAPERRGLVQPYRMPGDRVEQPDRPEPEPELPPAPDFRLLATVAGGETGTLVLQTEDGPPRVLRTGQLVLGYRVARIEDGRAVMENADRSLELIAVGPTPVPIGDVSRASDRQERAIEQFRTRMQDLQAQLRDASDPQARRQIQMTLLETARQLQEVAEQAEQRRDRRRRGGG